MGLDDLWVFNSSVLWDRCCHIGDLFIGFSDVSDLCALWCLSGTLMVYICEARNDLWYNTVIAFRLFDWMWFLAQFLVAHLLVGGCG
eukprot:gene2748-1733_t